MTNFLVVSSSSLREQPDDSTSEIVRLKANDLVAGLHQLVTWEKVSFTNDNGQVYLGWLHVDALKEVSAVSFQLYDQPFGTTTTVTGELLEVKIVLEAWRKVRVRLSDGSVVEGWLNDATTPDDPEHMKPDVPEPGAQNEPALSLGPNEPFRAFLLRGQRVTDIDAAALAAIVDAEAEKLPNGMWNANSVAASSGAAGLTQFIAATWIGQAKRSGTVLNQAARSKGLVTGANDVAPGQESELLSLRFDPELSIVSAAEYGRSNLDQLVKDGLVDDEIGDDEKAHFIYLAHHEGPAGAAGYIRKTRTYTFSDLARQVGAGRAQGLIDAAGGDATKAYRSWLAAYIDDRIRPSRFRAVSAAPLQPGEGTSALQQFAGPAIPIADLSNERALAKAVQWRLSELGYLDPPADGLFLEVSIWALSEFCDLNGLSLQDGFTRVIAQRLLSPAKQLPAIAKAGNWFDRVMDYMARKKYFVCRHPDCKNIVYIEGADRNGTVNDDAPNVFNDLRIVFSIDGGGRPNFATSIWEGTTEPGKFWTFHPMNPKGAARIAFNQYKSWVVGTHHANTPGAHEALIQAAEVGVFRDLNMDFKRPGDRLESGLFGINQHWGYDAPVSDLGRTSAGCLVGRTKDGHRKFMSLVKDDPRYKVNHSYKFLTAIMPGDEVLAT